jgi:Ca-activated chloride channel family protein
MITWRDPSILWVSLLVPVVAGFLLLALRRRRRDISRFADTALLPSLIPEHDARRVRTRAVLIVVATALLVLALAGPRWGFQWEEVRRQGVDIVIALDTSRSMLAEDVKPNRLERAKLAVLDLVKQLKGDRIGLVVFAGTAFLQCPLTLDYDAFAESLQAVNVGIIPKGGTAIAEAITASVAALESRQGKHEAIVLITDGEDHEGKIEEAARQAADRGVKIYAVGIGTPDGELIPVTVDGQQTFLKDRRGQVVKSRLDTATLEKIVTTTGGAYVRASGPQLGLDEVFSTYISKLDKHELQSTLERRFEDRYQLPLAFAVILLVLELFVGNRRRLRRPHARRAAGTTREAA